MLEKLLVSLTGRVRISSSGLGDITVEQCGCAVTVTFGTMIGGTPALPVAVTNTKCIVSRRDGVTSVAVYRELYDSSSRLAPVVQSDSSPVFGRLELGLGD